MPRTLPAELTTVMDAVQYEAYLRVVVNSNPNDTGAVTVQPIAFKIEDTRASVTIPYSLAAAMDEGYFRIVRGALINGTPSTISTAWYAFQDFIFDQKFITYNGMLLDRSYVTVAADSDYETVIETALTGVGANNETLLPSYEGAAAWKAYQFYPDGKTIVLSPRQKLFTILQQKYLIFATDGGWDGSDSHVYFFVATQSRSTDYTVIDPLLNYVSHREDRKLIWRDEANTVHSLGNNDNILHNLGYLESTADDPVTIVDFGNNQIGTKTSHIPVHLKYQTGDMVRLENGDNSYSLEERIKVTEVLDLKATPAWYQVLEVLQYFGSTEGGSMPSTIEAAAPYTPLVTGNFDGILSANDNNIQAAMETIDDHEHAASGGVTSGPQAFGDNYVITPSVATNNLTVALKTVAGADPSAGDPITIRIGNTKRTISAAISTTKNAGTNWCNGGSTEHKTQDIDYFVYLIQETGASAGTKIGFSRIPYARVMGDFVNTTTSEKYIAGNWTNFNSTDEVENIGRFNAANSGTASFNWSIPATSIVINRPIYESRPLVWAPQPGGGYASITVTYALYWIIGKIWHYTFRTVGTTSGATAVPYVTTPFESNQSANTPMTGPLFWFDGATGFGGCYINAGTPDRLVCAKYNSAAYANSANVNLVACGECVIE